MLYLWSCNQSVAWKCRHWNMLRPKIYWTKSQRNLVKFQNFEKFNIKQICTDVTVLLHSIWELLSNTLFAFTFDYSFFHFLPVSSGRNWKKHLFSSFFHSSGEKPISSGSFRTLLVRWQYIIKCSHIRPKKKKRFVCPCAWKLGGLVGRSFFLFIGFAD